MKRFLVVAVLVLGFAGCIPGSVREEIRNNRLRCDRFVQLMDLDETTRDQERAFVRANQEAWAALDEKYGE